MMQHFFERDTTAYNIVPTYKFANIVFNGSFPNCLDHLLRVNDKKTIEEAVDTYKFEAYDYLIKNKPENIIFISAITQAIPESIFFTPQGGLSWLEQNPKYLDSIVLKHIEENLSVPDKLINLLAQRTLRQREHFISLPHLKTGKGYADLITTYLTELPLAFFKKLEVDQELLRSLVLKPLKGLAPSNSVERCENMNILQMLYCDFNKSNAVYISEHYLDEVLDMTEHIYGYTKKSNLLEYILRDAINNKIYVKVKPLQKYFDLLDRETQNLYSACLFASLRFEQIDKNLPVEALCVVPFEMLEYMRQEYFGRLLPEVQVKIDALMLNKKLESTLDKHIEHSHKIKI